MNYLEWNNLIANHFFNLDNAGKNIHLFITKQEIINLGRGNFNEETDEEIWADFLRKLKNGLPGSSCFPNIFDKALYAFQQWEKPGIKSIEGVEVKYPLYISYLVFTVLPLIEIQGDYNSNNYFDRLADFLTENNIDQNLRGKLRYIDCLWNDLSFWANERKNGGIGLFNTVVFKHTTWKFVGKPFSQCVIPPKAIKKLPEFFSCSGLTPNSFYQDDIFKNRLIRNGLSILGLKPSVIELIKKGNKDEIGQSIIETVKTEFSKWTGEEHETILKDGIAKTIRRKTVVPLKLQFKINEDGELDFSFRAKYLTEPPPGLRFEEFEDIYENENWSRTLCRPFKESFELRDITNKWIAKFEFRNIRLFIRGGYYQLSNDFWIEIESLSRVEGIFLLCKNSIKDSIKEWCEKSCREFKDYSTLLNLPSGNSLFWIKDPQSSHDQFQQLRVYKDKAITLRTGTGLKIGYRTYLKDMLPEIEIINADGNETVYLQYETSEEKTKLIKHHNLGGIWLLPNTLLLNSSFFIQIENEFIDGYRQTYKIDEVSLRDLSNDFLPKRNKYNDLIEDSTEYIQGNNIQNSGTINTIVDGQSFSPNISATIQQAPSLKFKDNLLLKWLVGIKECGITEFNEAFETVLHKSFAEEQIKIQERRKYSINILDHLGYVDYHFENGKVFTLPSKLISIPCSRGRKALLIGGRDDKLINEMIKYCHLSKNKISLSVKKQNEKNLQLLIPDSILLESNNSGEFVNLANHFQIEFDECYILKLKNFLPTLNKYEQFIINKGSSESWERFGLEKKVFKKDSLKFESVDEFDKEYALTEFRPSYIPEFGLWVNQSYYIVDKNWGKYLILNHYSEKVRGYGHENYFAKPVEIFCNTNNLAIPASLPLPKLFSRIILQLSGEVPDFKQMNLKGKNVWYNVYRNVPSLFTENFFRFILNMIIETTTQKI
jgi:hypothetical protein